MKKQLATGFLPYEINDVVTVEGSKSTHVITDIIFIQSVKNQTARFRVELDNNNIIDADKVKTRTSNEIPFCICDDFCLGACHKDRRCKGLK